MLPIIEPMDLHAEREARSAGSAEIKDNNLVISAILSADPSAFLNPEYLVNALRSHTGVLSSTDLMSESYTVMREAAYFADMSEFR